MTSKPVRQASATQQYRGLNIPDMPTPDQFGCGISSRVFDRDEVKFGEPTARAPRMHPATQRIVRIYRY